MASFLLNSTSTGARRRLLRGGSDYRHIFWKSFSSQPPKMEDKGNREVGHDESTQQQEFVTVKLEPGEWDEAKTDPLHRPPWKNRARIISEEDYANRPRVSFEEEFNSLHDAMVVLSWLDRKTQEQLYDAYLNMMESLRSQNKKTSHDYVVRVLGQNFNISAARAAAVIQLLHNEDQIRKEHPEQELHHTAQEYADAKIQEHIMNAYGEFRETPPGVPFVEDPMGVDGMGDVDRRRRATVVVDDLQDILDLTERATIREEDEARLAIDGHIYNEDVDENLMEVTLSNDCRKLVAKQQELKEVMSTERPDTMTPLPDSGETRARWKYVAQTINTREMKRKTKKNKRRTKNANRLDDTIVEQNGELRVATVAEAKGTSWKPVRNQLEFTFGDVKEAWLRRTRNGESEGWGRIEARKVPKVAATEENGENDEGGGGDSSSESTSSDDGTESSSSSSSSDSDSNADSEEPKVKTDPDKDDKE